MNNGRPKVSYKGSNNKGHTYYNHPGRQAFLRFNLINSTFSKSFTESSGSIKTKIGEVIKHETKWVDSLLIQHEISQEFAVFMKLQIQSSLAWQVGELCTKYIENADPLSAKSKAIKDFLFTMLNPLDERLKSCFSGPYYSTYFNELFKRHAGKVNEADIIHPDVPAYVLAPDDMQSFLWGKVLFYNHNLNPDKDLNCSAYMKYKARFPESEFNEYFNNANICEAPLKTDSKFIDIIDTDFFSTVRLAFSQKRILIDLWATWCVPCKIEFAKQQKPFYDFLHSKHISMVYVSIDKPKLREKWRSEVLKYNLTGYHVLAGRNLQESIKDVIYHGVTVSIPRYILIDEKGKILSGDFPKPSSLNFDMEISKAFPN